MSVWRTVVSWVLGEPLCRKRVASNKEIRAAIIAYLYDHPGGATLYDLTYHSGARKLALEDCELNSGLTITRALEALMHGRSIVRLPGRLGVWGSVFRLEARKWLKMTRQKQLVR